MVLENYYKNYKESYKIMANIIMDWNTKIICKLYVKNYMYRTFYKLE